MWAEWQQTSPRERTTVVAGFITLAALMMGHVLMETAADAIFLAHLPATQLPLVYLAIAVLSVLVTRLERWLRRTFDARSILVGWLLFAAATALGLWGVLEPLGEAAIYVLYIFPGVISTVTLIQFWVLLGSSVTHDEAKHIYVLLGAGGAVGAIFGSGIAALVSALFQPAGLIVLAAGVWALIPLGVGRFVDSLAGSRALAERPATRPVGWSTIRKLFEQTYARRVAALALLIPVAAILGDYLFKSLAAQRVDPASLGTFFGSVYLLLNFASLVFQLLAVRGTVRQVGITTALAILPGLIALGGLGVAVGMAFTSAISIKVFDGSLRFSLYQTATELLYVPLPEDMRHELKAFATTVAKRGGQAIGSVGLVVLLAGGGGSRTIGLTLLVVAAAAVVVAASLRGPYRSLFRFHLRDERVEHLFDYPDLDPEMPDTLTAALADEEDDRVLAALDLLETADRHRPIPALILYHPSVAVVRRALAIFVERGADEIVPALRRRQQSASAELQALLVSGAAALDQATPLETYRDDPSELVRTVAAIHRIARHPDASTELSADLADAIERAGVQGRRTLSFAIGNAGAADFLPALEAMLDQPDPEVRHAAVAAMVRLGEPAALDALTRQLTDRPLQIHLYRAIAAFGSRGFDHLRGSLEEADLPQAIRHRLPRAIGEFASPRAVALLASHLTREPQPAIRDRLVAELERLRMLDESLTPPADLLEGAIARVIGRAYRQRERRAQLAEAVDPTHRDLEAYLLLRQLLTDRIHRCRDLTLRLLGLRFPHDDVAGVRRGLGSREPTRRRRARQMLGDLLPANLEEAVVGLFDGEDTPVSAAAEAFYEPKSLSDRRFWDQLVGSGGEPMVMLAAELARQADIRALRPPLVDALEWVDGEARQTVKDALLALTPPSTIPRSPTPSSIEIEPTSHD